MSNPRPPRKYIVLEPLFLALMMIIGIVIGYKLSTTENEHSLIQKLNPSATPVGRIEELIRFIDNKYVDTIDMMDLEDRLIETVLEELDPHSVYIPPTELEEINLQMSGKYNGIGIETMLIEDTFYISKILPESPAEISNLEIGMQVISINDSIVAGKDLSYGDLSSLIRENNEVSISLIDKFKKEHVFQLEPKELVLNSAGIHYKIDDHSGYIKLERFTSKSYEEFMKALEELVTDEKLENLIIDLRDNPGGFLPQANKILSQLFPNKDKLLLYTQGENSPRQEYKTTGRNFFDVENVAVLINEGSASGSEILAGAIQDWDRGVIVGAPSYGKGLVQEQYPLRNGGAIRLTVAKYFTPSGRLIQKPYHHRQYLEEEATSSEDIYEDRLSGSHFEKNKKDSSAFKSLLLNRNLMTEGGIVPDILIEDESPKDLEQFVMVYDELRSQLFKSYLRGEYLMTKENFPLDQSIIEKIKYQLNNSSQLSAITLQSFDKELEKESNYLLAKMIINENFANKIYGQFDQAQIKALSALKKENVLAEFID